MILTVPTKHKGCTQVHINHSVVLMTSAGEEQAGMLSMSPSAAKPITRSIDITFLKFSVYEPIIVKFTMGIKLYPTSKNPAADIFGQFQVISSVKWLIYFKSGKSYSLIDIIAIKVNLLDFESRTL